MNYASMYVYIDQKLSEKGIILFTALKKGRIMHNERSMDIMRSFSRRKPTSDANTIYCATNGFIWIGSYCGLIIYDGNDFGRMDASFGISNANARLNNGRKEWTVE